MNLFYLERSKEELNIAYAILNQLNDDSIVHFLNHLMKSMGFMADYMNDRHVDLYNELPNARVAVNEKVGKDFFETYFYLSSMSMKEFRVLNDSSILVNGRETSGSNTMFMKTLAAKVTDYFNKVYSLTEQGLIN